MDESHAKRVAAFWVNEIAKDIQRDIIRKEISAMLKQGKPQKAYPTPRGSWWMRNKG